MFKQDEHIGGYRLRQNEHSVVIDEREGFSPRANRILFGLVFMFPLALCIGAFFPNGFFGVKWESPSVHYPIWRWLIFIPFLCIPFVFAFADAYHAFSRDYVEAINDKIFVGVKWFNLWAWLNIRPISEISSINSNWTRRGPFAGRRVCGVFIIPAKSNKLINLVCCVKHRDALKLAKVISDKTNLPIQDITDPICLTTR